MVLCNFKNVSRVNYSTLSLPPINIFIQLSVFDDEISIILPTQQTKRLKSGSVIKPSNQTKIHPKQFHEFSGVHSPLLLF